MEEPKKISFGFSKVSKKNTILQPKKQNDDKNDKQFIECLEGKSIKLVNGQDNEVKELPIIPMRNGNLLRDSIMEVIKSREINKDVDGANINNKELTLEELAAKEILEDLKKNENKDDEKSSQLAVNLNSLTPSSNQEPSSLDDYDSMPISEFGLAMLRGMGWDPKKGIGLNGKIVTPLLTNLRPKGMGLGADKTVAAKNIASNGEVLIMKKGAAIKIISGPHNNLYGKIEGFDELPGRLMVRIAATNVIVSLNEIMVQLVSTSEFNKNADANQLNQSSQESEQNRVIADKRRLNNVDTYELISSDNSRESKQKEKYDTENRNRDEDRSVSSSEGMRSKKYNIQQKSNKEENRRRSRSPKHQKSYSARKTYDTDSKFNRYKDYKESRKPRRRSSSSSSSSSDDDRKADKKFNRRTKYESNSSDSDKDLRKKSYKSKQYSSHSSSNRRSHAREEIEYSSKYKRYHRR